MMERSGEERDVLDWKSERKRRRKIDRYIDR